MKAILIIWAFDRCITSILGMVKVMLVLKEIIWLVSGKYQESIMKNKEKLSKNAHIETQVLPGKDWMRPVSSCVRKPCLRKYLVISLGSVEWIKSTFTEWALLKITFYRLYLPLFWIQLQPVFLKLQPWQKMFLHLRPPYEAILFGHIHLCSLALPKYWQAKTASRAREQRTGRRDCQLLG